MATHKSVETKYLEERRQFFHGLRNLDRRSFLKVSAAALGATAGLAAPHSFTPVTVAQGAESSESKPAFRFAYISDSHLYEKKRQRPFRAGVAPRGRRREQARPAARLRLLWRRLGATRSGQAARVGRPDPQESQGPAEDHGRRARLVSRSGPEVAGDVRQIDLLLRPQRGPLRRSQ